MSKKTEVIEKMELISLEERTVTCEFTSPLLGTVTADKEIYKSFIAEKATKENTAEELTALPKTVEEMEIKGWTRFAQDETGLFLWDYMAKGFLKHAGEVLKEKHKVEAIRGRIDDCVVVSPRRIYLMRNGQKVQQADEVFERPLRVMLPTGPRVCLSRSDMMNAPLSIEFTIKVLEGRPGRKKEGVQAPAVSMPLMLGLLDYGQWSGFGQFRNGGFGQFTWKKN